MNLWERYTVLILAVSLQTISYSIYQHLTNCTCIWINRKNKVSEDILKKRTNKNNWVKQRCHGLTCRPTLISKLSCITIDMHNTRRIKTQADSRVLSLLFSCNFQNKQWVVFQYITENSFANKWWGPQPNTLIENYQEKIDQYQNS